MPPSPPYHPVSLVRGHLEQSYTYFAEIQNYVDPVARQLAELDTRSTYPNQFEWVSGPPRVYAATPPHQPAASAAYTDGGWLPEEKEEELDAKKAAAAAKELEDERIGHGFQMNRFRLAHSLYDQPIISPIPFISLAEWEEKTGQHSTAPSEHALNKNNPLRKKKEDIVNPVKQIEQDERERDSRKEANYEEEALSPPMRSMKKKADHQDEAIIPSMRSIRPMRSMRKVADYEEEALIPPMGPVSKDNFACDRITTSRGVIKETVFIPPNEVRRRLGYSELEEDFTAEEHKIFIEEYCRQQAVLDESRNTFELPIWGGIASKPPGRSFQQCIQHYHIMKDFVRGDRLNGLKKEPGYKAVVKTKKVVLNDGVEDDDVGMPSFKRTIMRAFDERMQQVMLTTAGAGRQANQSKSKSRPPMAVVCSTCKCQSIDEHCSGACASRPADTPIESAVDGGRQSRLISDSLAVKVGHEYIRHKVVSVKVHEDVERNLRVRRQRRLLMVPYPAAKLIMWTALILAERLMRTTPPALPRSGNVSPRPTTTSVMAMDTIAMDSAAARVIAMDLSTLTRATTMEVIAMDSSTMTRAPTEEVIVMEMVAKNLSTMTPASQMEVIVTEMTQTDLSTMMRA